MLDYLTLQGSTENPTFTVIVMTVLLSFLLSSSIAITYQKTSKLVITPMDFLQALILVGVVAAMVMQAIGDSLARGIGMMGALAIIRFRTNVKNPRNMIFTFASLAAGICCGVYGFVIGITGTVGFCIIAFILRFSPMGEKNNLVGHLNFDVPPHSETIPLLEEILNRFCHKYALIGYQVGFPKIKGDSNASLKKMISYEYRLKLRNNSDGDKLDAEISELENLEKIKINFEKIMEII